jgi:hypothetical protein
VTPHSLRDRAALAAMAGAALIVIAAAIVFTFRATYDPDLFWHLAQGRHALEHGIVRANVFSWAHPAYPQHYTSAGFEIAAALAMRAGGWVAVQGLQAVLIAIAGAVLLVGARRAGAWASALCVLLVSVWVIESRAMPRPYLVSWIGFGVLAAAFTGALGGTRRLRWLVPVTVALWANAHSEAVLGAALVCLYAACERDRQWGMIAVLSVMATLATPYGWGLWRYLYENTAVPVVLRIAELQPPSLEGYAPFYVYLVVLGAALASMPRRLRLSEIAVVLFAAALGLRYIRFTPIIVFATAPILSARIAWWIARGWDARAALVTAAGLFVVFAPASPARMQAAWRVGEAALALAGIYSRDAVSFIQAHDLDGPMFNSMNLGGYLDWTLGGGTFVDSRLQAVPASWFAALTDAAASEDPAAWATLVRECDWAIVSLARQSDIGGVDKFDAAEWVPVFRDRAAEILVRRNGRYAELGRRLALPISR